MQVTVSWTYTLHRYIGIGLGLLMLIWCLSGVVMMYVPYPSLSESERVAGLRPLDWRQCRFVPAAGADWLSIEMMNGRLLLRERNVLVDLANGHHVAAITSQDALAVARDYARGNGIKPGVVSLESIFDDQWTVSGEFRRDRPLFRVHLHDATNTWVYVSGTSGRVVQSVAQAQRFWNYLGAVPHWIYFTSIRKHPKAWAQVVIWTSIIGCFLTIIGLYIGIRQYLRARHAGRWSPYDGIVWWHHVPGVVFGIFLLSWVFSGLLSMNPWGLLESGDGGNVRAVLSGAPAPPSQLGVALRALAQGDPRTVSLSPASLDGVAYFLATRTDGVRQRLDLHGRPSLMSAADRMFIAKALTGDAHLQPVALLAGDDYYLDLDPARATPPVWRFIARNGDRYYVDPLSGKVVALFDSAGRSYRWLFQGLHRLDFASPLRVRPVWDVVMLVLLAGASTSAGTGVWLGLRYLLRLVGKQKQSRR